MNLHFQTGRLRVRLQASELEQLLAGTQLCLALGPKSLFGTCVVRADNMDAAEIVRTELDVFLLLPRAELAELMARLPSKSGLSWRLADNPEFALVLEVDLRTRSV